MGDTNYISGVVKVLESPRQKIYNNNITVTEFRVQFPQFRGSRIINLVLWGKLASEATKSYKINDYIIIEGYLRTVKKQALKKAEVTAFKVFPFV